jgi:hypothetical protein
VMSWQKEIVLFCEGRKDSLDIKIYEKIKPSSTKITIKPLGSKFGSFSHVEGYRQSGGINSKKKFVLVRDRDFDFQMPPNPALIIGKENEQNAFYYYSTYKTTIENYLLSSKLLADFLGKDEKIIEIMLINAAKQIADYSAVRHALGAIRIENKRAETTWTGGSGKITTIIDKSFDECCNEARGLIQKFKNQFDDYNEERFEIEAKKFQTQFNQNEFNQKHLFLDFFNGKDLEKSISILAEKDQFNIDWNEYHKFAIEKINFLDFADMKELSEKLSKLIA